MLVPRESNGYDLVKPKGDIALVSVQPSVRHYPGIFWRTHWRNALKCGMLMYLDHLQNWEDFGHGLLICMIWAQLWLNQWDKLLPWQWLDKKINDYGLIMSQAWIQIMFSNQMGEVHLGWAWALCRVPVRHYFSGSWWGMCLMPC